MTPRPAVGHLAMLCFSVLVAGSFALGVLAANDIAPMALNAVRFWIASGDHRRVGRAARRVAKAGV